MVTITTLDEAQSVFWAPNAPLPCERLAALEFLHKEGFKTSVIMEPLLQGPCSALNVYQAASPFVTEAIWIGTMNMAEERVDVSKPENARAVEAIKRYHSIDNLRFLYETMKDLPKVKFKNSITRFFEKSPEK
jgi:DNA repair photolyase